MSKLKEKKPVGMPNYWTEEIDVSVQHLKPKSRRFHGAKTPLNWFPRRYSKSRCRNRFGYLTSFKRRKKSRLAFTATNQALLEQLGGMMGDPNRDMGVDSIIPSGYTYFGQFVDHDVTLDTSSSITTPTNANKISNMRTPALDLDCVYGRGPALDPQLYVFPATGSSAVKMVLGQNQNAGKGGPGGAGGMQTQTDFDLPRVPGTQTAVIGDPRNDENLIVSQLQHTMLKFHNKIVDHLVTNSFTGDVFAEAQRQVRHHYQWIVINDYLQRICGVSAVNHALSNVFAPIGSAFRMPVEFSVAAYRYGHSLIRNNYWVNFNFTAASLGDVFSFVRPPKIPVLSNWVVDFNAFVDTGISVPVFNFARKIDSVLSSGLEALPGSTGLMAVLAARNLRRGLAFGLPSGQAVAKHFGIPKMTSTQLTSGLQADEIAVLNDQNNLLLKKTPLWYYILREASVLEGGNQLGPVGARIVAETFVRMLKRDADSFLNHPGGFTPDLPSANPGTFELADIIQFAGVHLP